MYSREIIVQNIKFENYLGKDVLWPLLLVRMLSLYQLEFWFLFINALLVLKKASIKKS